MSSDRLRDTALWLLIIATVVFLMERLFVVLAFFANPLLLFALSWLLSLILQPIVQRITMAPIPIPARVQRLAGGARSWFMPISLAVPLVYLLVLALLTIFLVALVPAMAPQLERLTQRMPTTQALTNWIVDGEGYLRRLGFRGDLSTVVQPDALAQQIGSAGTTLVQQSLGLASSIASLLFSTFITIILSFYMTLDGRRIGERMIEVLPWALRDEARQLLDMVDRVFGGFLRAQILQSLIYGIATAFMMALLGINDVALSSVLAAILVAIPLIGSLLALIPAVLIALVEAPGQVFLLVAGLFLAQQILFNVIMPRLMGQSVGLHPLLVFAAMLVGGTIAGGWGLLFGIPVAGVIASVLQFLYQRASRSAFSAGAGPT